MRYAINLICILLTVLLYSPADSGMVIRGSGGGGGGCPGNLVTNGTFDTDLTGWGSAYTSVVGGEAVLENGSYAYIHQTGLGLSNGVTYDYSFDVTYADGNYLRFESPVNTGITGWISSTGTQSGSFTAGATDEIRIIISDSAAYTFNVDNVCITAQ